MNILSLGGGVQSSTVLMMSLCGELPPLDAVIFADTCDETEATYRYLDGLKARCLEAGLSFHRVSVGNIAEDTRAGRLPSAGASSQDARFATMPLHLRTPNGRGMLRRQCTNEYKIRPIRKCIRELLAEQKTPVPCLMWIGISLDEAAHRMKTSAVKYIVNHYPLVEARLTRHDCELWLDRHGYERPPKSACKRCPFHDNGFWRALKRDSPAEFAEVCQFDVEIRTLKRIKGEVFLHRNLIPLSEVDLSTAEDRGQLTFDPLGFANDCEGHCGV